MLQFDQSPHSEHTRLKFTCSYTVFSEIQYLSQEDNPSNIMSALQISFPCWPCLEYKYTQFLLVFMSS